MVKCSDHALEGDWITMSKAKPNSNLFLIQGWVYVSKSIPSQTNSKCEMEPWISGRSHNARVKGTQGAEHRGNKRGEWHTEIVAERERDRERRRRGLCAHIEVDVGSWWLRWRGRGLSDNLLILPSDKWTLDLSAVARHCSASACQTHTRTCTHTHTHTHTHTQKHTRRHINANKLTYTAAHRRTFTGTHRHIQTHGLMHAHTEAHRCMHTNKHPNTNTHIHTHKQTVHTYLN